MPTISAFYGIIVRMYHRDHEPAHFHAFYQGNEAKIDIEKVAADGWPFASPCSRLGA
jgi:hypothetical protein